MAAYGLDEGFWAKLYRIGAFELGGCAVLKGGVPEGGCFEAGLGAGQGVEPDGRHSRFFPTPAKEIAGYAMRVWLRYASATLREKISSFISLALANGRSQ